MEQDQESYLLGKVVEKNRHFENLLANEDFLKWRDTNVIPHLESIRDAVLSADRSQPDWRDRVAEGVVAYQEAKKTYDTLFVLAAKNAEAARRQLGAARGQAS